MSGIPTTLEHRVLHPEGTREAKHPTLIMLHGRGADEEDLLSLAGEYDPRLLVLSVRAPIKFAYGGYTWYEFLENAVPDPSNFRAALEQLEQFLDEARLYNRELSSDDVQALYFYQPPPPRGTIFTIR